MFKGGDLNLLPGLHTRRGGLTWSPARLRDLHQISTQTWAVTLVSVVRADMPNISKPCSLDKYDSSALWLAEPTCRYGIRNAVSLAKVLDLPSDQLSHLSTCHESHFGFIRRLSMSAEQGQSFESGKSLFDTCQKIANACRSGVLSVCQTSVWNLLVDCKYL